CVNAEVAVAVYELNEVFEGGRNLIHHDDEAEATALDTLLNPGFDFRSFTEAEQFAQAFARGGKAFLKHAEEAFRILICAPEGGTVIEYLGKDFALIGVRKQLGFDDVKVPFTIDPQDVDGAGSNWGFLVEDSELSVLLDIGDGEDLRVLVDIALELRLIGKPTLGDDLRPFPFTLHNDRHLTSLQAQFTPSLAPWKV
ncbi:hypothetical protein DRN74_05645, partial [Candidatus Micrarchaeota archaeon]